MKNVSTKNPFARNSQAAHRARKEAEEAEIAYQVFVHRRLANAAAVILSVHNKVHVERPDMKEEFQWARYISQNLDTFMKNIKVTPLPELGQMKIEYTPTNGGESKTFTINIMVLMSSDREIAKWVRQTVYMQRYRTLLVDIEKCKDVARTEGDIEKTLATKEKRMRSEAEKKIQQMRAETLQEVTEAKDSLAKHQKYLNILTEKVSFVNLNHMRNVA